MSTLDKLGSLYESTDVPPMIGEGVTSNNQLRAMLQGHGESIIKRNLLDGYASTCRVVKPPNAATPGAPYLYTDVNDPSTPYGYQSSDMKESYLAGLRENGRTYTQVVSQGDLLQRRAVNRSY